MPSQENHPVPSNLEAEEQGELRRKRQRLMNELAAVNEQLGMVDEEANVLDLKTLVTTYYQSQSTLKAVYGQAKKEKADVKKARKRGRRRGR